MNAGSDYNIGEVSRLAEKPLVEREGALWAASEKYMRGEISLKELREIEHPYVCLDHAKSIGALADEEEGQPQRGSSLLGAIAQLFKFP